MTENREGVSRQELGLVVIFGKFLLEGPLGVLSVERILSGLEWSGEEGQAFWWFPSWVRGPVLGLSVPNSGP